MASRRNDSSLFDAYDKSVAAGAFLTAIVQLGEQLRSVESGQADGLQSVEGRIRAHVEADVLERAGIEAVASWRRAMRILSIGTKFTWDELVLVLTLRSELALALLVMALFGIDPGPLDLPALDSELRKVAQSSANREAFASALAAVRKNWGNWVDDVWTPLGAPDPVQPRR